MNKLFDVHWQDLARSGIPKRLGIKITGVQYKEIKATSRGEFRPPKKGEWYLSGAIPEAYVARNDLSTPYHIVQLVRVKEVITPEVVEIV